MKGRTPHIEHQANHFSDVRNEMIAIRGDMHGLERRIIDKIDENRDKASENQKWIIVLLIYQFLSRYLSHWSQNEYPMCMLSMLRARTCRKISGKGQIQNVVITTSTT